MTVPGLQLPRLHGRVSSLLHRCPQGGDALILTAVGTACVLDSQTWLTSQSSVPSLTRSAVSWGLGRTLASMPGYASPSLSDFLCRESSKCPLNISWEYDPWSCWEGDIRENMQRTCDTVGA